MGNKYADDTIKYKLIAKIDIDGVVNEADIVGALFGQTEGLLDTDMELKQLQRTGRIGRIDLEINNKSGQTRGTITVPSSLNKIETAIIAATLESVDRVGACSCKIDLERIVDVRKDKRDQIARRAAEIMKKWDLEKQSDSVDIPSIVEQDSKRGRIISFGSERLAAGPGIYDSNEIILVEGRADVANLLKMDIDNTIAMGGTSIPNTIVNLCKTRTVTALLDGDRGGDMILKELLLSASLEYVARAPYKKEVENLSINEVREAIANKTPILDAEFMTEKYSVYSFLKKNERFDIINKQNGRQESRGKSRRTQKSGRPRRDKHKDKGKRRGKGRRDRTRDRRRRREKITVPKPLHNIINSTKQTMNAVFVDDDFNEIKTVSTADAFEQMQELDEISSIVVDGVITQRLLQLADKKRVKIVAGAVLGDIQEKPKSTKYVTFNRL